MEIKVELPVIMKVSNVGSIRLAFQPYHENFSVNVPAGTSVEFEVATVGQYFYYMEQATKKGLEVSKLSAFDSASDTIIVIDLPSLVTLENVVENAVNFNPYRENFPVTIAKGDKIVLEATTAGQVLYYLAQAQVNKGIKVTFAAKPASNPGK